MKGYIVKLYQKFHNIEIPETNRQEFNVWFSFDFMRIIPVDYFEDFYKKSMNIKVDEIDIRDLSCSRQKMYLCGENESAEDIFSMTNDKPILSLTMVKFRKLCTRDEQEKYLKLFFEKKGVDYCLFDSLSHSDKVIVIRENSYEKIMDVLIELQCFRQKNEDIIRKVYTIGCLNIDKKDFLSTTDSVFARVGIPFNHLRDIVIDSAELDNCIMGKEDVEIMESGSSKDIIDNFIRRGVITNTGESRVMNRMILLKSCSGATIQDMLSTNHQSSCKSDIKLNDLKTMLLKVEVQSYSISIKNLMNRLIIRAWQMNYVNDLIVHDNTIWDKVKKFTEIAIGYSEQRYHNDSAVEGMKALSLLMDNMSSDNYDDFEIPQGNSRFTGTMSRLLRAYNNLLMDLSELTRLLRVKSREKDPIALDYLTWAVIDTNEVVSAKQLFIDAESRDRLLIISLSHEAMFHIREVIAWSIHEIGHYLRTDWSRRDRNETLRDNAERVFLLVYEAYLGEEKKLSESQISVLNRYFKTHTICNNNVCEYRMTCTQESCKYKHIDDHVDKLMIHYNNVLRDLFDGKILDNCGLSIEQYILMKQDIENYLLVLKKAYREAQADMYMISVLEIQDVQSYVGIVRKYFEYSQMNIEEIDVEVLIRTNAVIIAIDSKNKKCPVKDYTFDKFKSVLEDSSFGEAKQFIDSLQKNNMFYAFAHKLAEFLEIVNNSIEKALQNEECKVIKDRIVKSYRFLEPKKEHFDSFRSAWEFIDEYEKGNA